VVGDLLRERTMTIASRSRAPAGCCVAADRRAGSSDYVERGVVCYSNRSKTELAGWPEALIAEHGAVSEPVARRWPEGIRARAGTSIGVGVTGIAGLSGGSAEKPVGTVAVAVVVDGEARRAHVPVRGRARDGEVSGGAVGAEHDTVDGAAASRAAVSGPNVNSKSMRLFVGVGLVGRSAAGDRERAEADRGGAGAPRST
jgi:PncC family amidohydrolase